MKLDKNIIIILTLTSLLLSAVGGVFYLYTENKKIEQKGNILKVVFVAANNIPKNTKIEKKDLKSVKVASLYILTPPLLENEIVGKYAKEEILANDSFRKEKLSATLVEEEQKEILFNNTSYNIGFKLFSNPNFSLKKGETINIISVYPAENSKQNMDYAVQYIAANIKILGFLEKGDEVSSAFRIVKKNKVDKKGNKLEEIEDVTVYADELLLDIEQNVIIKLIDDYNKGRQLWMVKVKSKEDEIAKVETIPTQNQNEEQKIVQKFIDVAKNQKAYKVKTLKEIKDQTRRVAEAYRPYSWYNPKEVTQTQTATITYADTNKVEQPKVVTIVKNTKCDEKKKLLVGKTYDVALRDQPSKRATKKNVVAKHTFIPYIKKTEDGWYEVCDGNFVFEDDVEEISYEEAVKKIDEN
jgi:hypothetical protein